MRVEFLEYVQISERRLGLVEILRIRSTPAKCFPRNVLDAARIHTAFLQNVLVFRAKVIAHHGDHSHLREVAGRERKIRRRPAQNALHCARKRRDVIKRNRTHHNDAHLRRLLPL